MYVHILYKWKKTRLRTISSERFWEFIHTVDIKQYRVLFILKYLNQSSLSHITFWNPDSLNLQCQNWTRSNHGWIKLFKAAPYIDCMYFTSIHCLVTILTFICLRKCFKNLKCIFFYLRQYIRRIICIELYLVWTKLLAFYLWIYSARTRTNIDARSSSSPITYSLHRIDSWHIISLSYSWSTQFRTDVVVTCVSPTCNDLCLPLIVRHKNYHFFLFQNRWIGLCYCLHQMYSICIWLASFAVILAESQFSYQIGVVLCFEII